MRFLLGFGVNGNDWDIQVVVAQTRSGVQFSVNTMLSSGSTNCDANADVDANRQQ